MANTPYYTKAEIDARENSTVREIQQTVLSIGAGESGVMYDTLAQAQAVEPKPANGTVFQVSTLDSGNAGVYTFQSSGVGGVRFERGLIKGIEEIGVELNLFKKYGIVEGSRTANIGYIMSDPTYFRTITIPVTEGKRYATVSSNTGVNTRFSFYNSETAASDTFISLVQARDAVAPVGATHMIVAATLSLKDSYILIQLDSGFPSLGQDTFNYNDLYTKEEVDVSLQNLDRAKWYPDTFELDTIDTVTTNKVLYISDNDTLYGTNGFRDIFKASNVDLSDYLSVCTLPSGSTLQKLLFVSSNKAVGYVRSSISTDEGFYCFDNADTNAWTARRISKMRAGFPGFTFQSLVKTPNSSHIFSCSYSDGDEKITDPEDTTTQAPIDVYRSTDLGETWQIVYTHSERLNTHMHALEWDKYRDRLWVCIGDENAGGRPGWAYSDDYGDTFVFVENNDAADQPPFMDTAIIPTRKYVLFGSDAHPAGIRKWEPTVDEKNAVVSNEDVTSPYLIPVEQTQNFGFAKNPVVDISSYPYKIGMVISHAASYSKSCVLLSPNFKDWFMLDLVNDPQTEVSWSSFSGITSDGWVLGWCTLTSDGTQYYRRFKFPNWIKN